MGLLGRMFGKDPRAASAPADRSATTPVVGTGNELLYLLDRSGSMAKGVDDLLKGINASIENNRGDPAATTAYCHIVTFDSMGFDKIRDRELMRDLRALTRPEVEPRALTPLNDAIGYCIDPIIDGPQTGKKILIIFTDGLENHSKKYQDVALLRERIEQFERLGHIVIFLGANLDAQKVGAAMGIPTQRSMNVRANGQPGTSSGLMSGFALAAGLGLAYWALKPGDAQAAQSLGFSDADRQAAMGGFDNWQEQIQMDIAGAPTEDLFTLAPEVVEQAQELPTDFDPSKGSLDNEQSENFQAAEAREAETREVEESRSEPEPVSHSDHHVDTSRDSPSYDHSSSSSDWGSSGSDSGGGDGGGGSD